MFEKKAHAIANTLFFAGYIVLPIETIFKVNARFPYVFMNTNTRFLYFTPKTGSVYLVTLYSPIGG